MQLRWSEEHSTEPVKNQGWVYKPGCDQEDKINFKSSEITNVWSKFVSDTLKCVKELVNGRFLILGFFFFIKKIMIKKYEDEDVMCVLVEELRLREMKTKLLDHYHVHRR